MDAKLIKTMVNKGVAAKPHTQWPLYGSDKALDRTKYVTASEIGYCERKIKFDKLALAATDYSPEQGTAQVAKGWGFFERGHCVEAWFIDTITRAMEGARLILAGVYQRSFANRYQSGTPDGVFLIEDNAFKILEVKSMDPRTKISGLPKPEHVKQVTQNCDLVEHTLEKTCLGGIVVYIDASNYENIYPVEIPFDHERAAELEAKAERIMTRTPAELSPEGIYAGQCGFCNHTVACNALVRAPAMEKMTNDDLKSAAGRIFGQLQGDAKGAR